MKQAEQQVRYIGIRLSGSLDAELRERAIRDGGNLSATTRRLLARALWQERMRDLRDEENEPRS